MRSKEEIRKIVEGFAKSGMTRREYCARHGVAMTTFDYWRRAHRKRRPTLVPVALLQCMGCTSFATWAHEDGALSPARSKRPRSFSGFTTVSRRLM